MSSATGGIYTGKSQQRKGRDAERELAKIFQGYGYDVRPGVPVSFGAEPDLVGLKGIHCELKRREHVDLSAALKQAPADAEKFGDGVPCVFHRGNRQNWRVTMTLEGWLSLYAAAERDFPCPPLLPEDFGKTGKFA